MSLPVKLKRFVARLRPTRVVPVDLDSLLERSAFQDTVQRFNDLYYTNMRPLTWRNREVLKNPCDLWQMLEIIQEVRPELLIETGTHEGGSASFYVDVARALEIPLSVVTVDRNPKWDGQVSAGIVQLVGTSTSRAVVKQIADLVERTDGPVLVTLDSDHSMENVLAELHLYAEFVTPGSYVVVEDTNVNGHPSFPTHGPGPWEAVDVFLRERKDFEVDRSRERLLLTFNPRGWLKRVR